MDVSQVIILKGMFELKLHEMICEFEKDTGVKIEGIKLASVIDVTYLDSTTSNFLRSKPEITVRL